MSGAVAGGGATPATAVGEGDVRPSSEGLSPEEKAAALLADAEASVRRDGAAGGDMDAAPDAAGGDLDAAEAEASLRSTVTSLERGLVERGVEARLLVLAMVGGEHLLLLGPPGTAKSELCRRLSAVGRFLYFERTLTRFSTPEELFGPLSLSALERDEYRRATDGYMPRAEVAFLDEIFKANSAILNTLLTLLNERLFDEGPARTSVPLLTAVAASNELPETDELDALFDRFLLRRCVEPVSDDAVLDLLLGDRDLPPGDRRLPPGDRDLPSGDRDLPSGDRDLPPGGESDGGGEAVAAVGGGAGLTLVEALAVVQARARQAPLPRWAAILLRDARIRARDGEDGAGWRGGSEGGSEGGSDTEMGGDEQASLPTGRISDRRLRQAADLMKACAASHAARHEVSIVDALAVLPHVLWNDPADYLPTRSWLA